MEIVVVGLKLAAVLALVLLNGFFVAAEFAIVKVRTTQIEPLLRKGQKRAAMAHHVITHLDAYLSATQLGITLASLGLGWLGEPFVAQLL
ncbi:MAG TPA: CNNM domain-containing protein, partial [Bacteroidota bacterium]|nr:CNNM domain-containing protein [Bacteroidota bacterium]